MDLKNNLRCIFLYILIKSVCVRRKTVENIATLQNECVIADKALTKFSCSSAQCHVSLPGLYSNLGIKFAAIYIFHSVAYLFNNLKKIFSKKVRTCNELADGMSTKI